MKNTLFILCLFVGLSSYGNEKDTYKTTSNIKEPSASTEIDNRRNRNHFQKGVHLLSIGYGAPNWGGQPFTDLKQRYLDDYSQGGYGPIFIKYDYAFADHWSIGFTGRITNTTVEYPIEDGDSTTNYSQARLGIAGMVRGNYHFGTTRRWDPYVGAGLGYGLSLFSLKSGNAENPEAALPTGTSPIAAEATIGARFFITPKFAAYAEVGYSQSIANFGFTFKLK